jgi:hypothetical protein
MSLSASRNQSNNVRSTAQLLRSTVLTSTFGHVQFATNVDEAETGSRTPAEPSPVRQRPKVEDVGQTKVDQSEDKGKNNTISWTSASF